MVVRDLVRQRVVLFGESVHFVVTHVFAFQRPRPQRGWKMVLIDSFSTSGRIGSWKSEARSIAGSHQKPSCWPRGGTNGTRNEPRHSHGVANPGYSTLTILFRAPHADAAVRID